ncbi:Asp23/Gls24 family envelope stress response protein [Streptomyces sp. SCL15-6]|uniref:Asp23/Gls24 family envelope stress response protein n=1 Tax=Streptomyces sp. SCL15-6 TaxID=2967222 RepID=UPI00296683A3|nr:Asp23/Gls24 family envelope stress response protein [Streptomyces sp. SCL15-6]
MTATGTTALLGVAGEAALAVPGVAGLQPRLTAAAPTRASTWPHRTPFEAGVRADRAPDGSGWHIEVRCVLTRGRRALDIARNVHDRVAAAVIAHLATHGVAEPVTVSVTVTGVAA